MRLPLSAPPSGVKGRRLSVHKFTGRSIGRDLPVNDIFKNHNMTKNISRIAQLYLRLALGLGFLLPVADRIGWLGAPGQKGVSWGNWENFAAYTNMLLPFLSRHAASVMGLLATIAEILFGICLIVGYKTKTAAYGGFLLTLIFALCMAIFIGIRAPFNYSVFSDSAGSLLLALIPVYYWSFDNGFKG
jgi:putative oxidoreductase